MRIEKKFSAIALSYEKRIAEAKKDGEKLTKKDKAEIYEEVMEDLEKGGISVDTIEEVIGGDHYNAFKEGVEDFIGNETYKAYQDAVAEEKALRDEYDELGKKTEATLAEQSRYRELERQVEELKTKSKSSELRGQLEPEIQRINALKAKLRQAVATTVKDSRLFESYRELQRSTEKYQGDVSKYKSEAARKTVQNLIDGGIANNTREFHAFADLLAQISEDKGVVFDVTNNERLKGTRFEVKGATVNAFVTDDGFIAINKDSKKKLNSLVGHEVTHVLEGTEFYTELQNAVKEYATKKGEWDTRLTAITELYKKHKPDADPVKELTADLVGDYLFTDRDFISNLSTKHRNLFEKIYDEIKYLAKVATAGSKEARALERAKHAFAEVYRKQGQVQKNTAQKNGTQYDITALEDGKVYVTASRKVINGTTKVQQRQDISKFFSELLQENPSIDIHTIEGDVLTISKAETAHKARDDHKTVDGKPVPMTDEEFAVKLNVEAHIDEVAEVSKKIGNSTDNKNHKFAQDGFTYRRAYFEDFDGQYYEVTLSIGHDGTIATVYNVGKIKESVPPSAKVIAVVGSKPLGGTLSDDIISQNSKKSSGSVKNSLSEDSNGNSLSEAQQDFFKNSAVRDENGNLKVMYHGTQNGGFHEFNSLFSDDTTSLFFVDSNSVASSYSGKSETYAARTFRTADDFNNFFAEIGADEYTVSENNGTFSLMEDGDEVATSDTAEGLYEEFRDWSGLGSGEVNYKVYLNLTNPLEVDAEGRDWNALPSVKGESDQYEYIKVLEVGNDGKVKIEYSMKGDLAPVTENVDLYRKFDYGLAETRSIVAIDHHVFYACPHFLSVSKKKSRKSSFSIFNRLFSYLYSCKVLAGFLPRCLGTCNFVSFLRSLFNKL